MGMNIYATYLLKYLIKIVFARPAGDFYKRSEFAISSDHGDFKI